jgi:integrase
MGVKIQKRNGAWHIVVHHAGQRMARRIGTSRQAAEDVRRQIEARLAAGEFRMEPEPDAIPKPTFKIYAEQWLKVYADVALKPSTAHRHRQILRSYLYPCFENIELGRIRRTHIKQFLADYTSAGKLSRNSIRLILATLSVILNHAVEDELLESNPAARLSRNTKTDKPKRQAQAMTRDEAERFLKAVQEECPEFHTLFLVALRAGLRRGELVALQFGDIEFGENEDDPNRFIFVQRNFVRKAFTTTKSRKSRRVDLSKQLRAALVLLRDKRLEAASSAEKVALHNALVFPSTVGTVLNPDNLTHRCFQPALAKAQLRPGFTLHSLRHTFGSLLIQQGASLTYVKEQMGHYSIQVTVDTYGHLVPGANISWMDRLDAPVRSTTEQESEAAPTADDGMALPKFEENASARTSPVTLAMPPEST